MARSREEHLRAKRESMARRRAANPETARAYGREFHYRNHERNKERLRQYYGKRFFWARATKLRGEGRATYRELARLWKEQRGRCALTGRRLDRTAEVDHILPKSRGGTDAASNLRWLCSQANIAKRNLTDQEFINLCKDAMQWLGERIAMVDELMAAADEAGEVVK